VRVSPSEAALETRPFSWESAKDRRTVRDALARVHAQLGSISRFHRPAIIHAHEPQTAR
jgi:uncharacterized phage-associated protein